MKVRSHSVAVWAAVLGTSLMIGSASSSNHLCEGFLPPNGLKIPVGFHYLGLRNNGGISEAQYNEIMDRIEKLYTPIVAEKGATLVVKRLWNDATVNASAERQGNNWIINMYGGIARHPDVTLEGEALIACHEMGHHLGGAPKVGSIFGPSWATNEGGADYFATLKCLRLFFASDDNAAIVAAAEIDPLARTQCEAQYKSIDEQNLCLRISMAGESVSYLFQDLNKDPVRPQYSTPDTTEVAKTNDNHPATQCRMDTYFGGSLCPVAVTVENSETDWKVGSCVQGEDPVGFRSRCWFQPNGGGTEPSSCPLGDQSICDSLCTIFPDLPFCQQ